MTHSGCENLDRKLSFSGMVDQEDLALKTAASTRMGRSEARLPNNRSARLSRCAILGLLALAVSIASVGAGAQQTIVIGGSGLPAIEVNLETALAPQTGRTNRVGGLLPDDRPPLVDIGSLNRSLLRPPTQRTTGNAPQRETPSAKPKTARSNLVNKPSTPRKPRGGTRIPATSFAAEIGPKSSGTQMAALPKATPPRASSAPTSAPPAKALKPVPKVEARVAPVPPPVAKPKPPAASVSRAPAEAVAEPKQLPPVKTTKRTSPPPVPNLPKQTAAAPTTTTAPPPPVVKPPPPAVRPSKSAPRAAAPPLTKPEPQAAPKPSETKVAALPPARTAAPQSVLTRLIFPAGAADVAGPLAEQLDNVARTMRTRDERLLLQAYAAASTSGSASGSRRLSLARALEVRSYLIRKGLKSTRIDVRALGTSDNSSPADRVDILLLTR